MSRATPDQIIAQVDLLRAVDQLLAQADVVRRKRMIWEQMSSVPDTPPLAPEPSVLPGQREVRHG